MNFTQPKLPYVPDALAPIISQNTVEIHYGRHEKNYIDTLNKLIVGTEYEDMSIEEIIRHSDGAIFNNASQSWNHIFYFFQFSQDGRHEPVGALRNAIDKEFGSFDHLKELMIESGKKLFGSGWIWLAMDDEGALLVLNGSNAENPLAKGMTPLLTIDVWEHAYYLDYQNRRADYLDSIWSIIDWQVIESRYGI